MTGPYVFDHCDDGDSHLNADEEKYAILSHNGIAWELQGVMQKKVKRSEADQVRMIRIQCDFLTFHDLV